MVFEELIFMGGVMGFALGVPLPFIWRLMQDKRWPVVVPVQEQRGSSIVWDFNERASSVKDKAGYEYYRLKKRRIDIKPPKFEELSITGKGRAVFPLYQTARGQLVVTQLKKSDPEHPLIDVVEDKGRMNWGILQHNITRQMYQTSGEKWQKWVPYIMSAAMCGLFAIMVIFIMLKFETISGSLAAMGAQIADALAASKK